MAPETKTTASRSVEVNILAILDSSGVRDARDVHDDRHFFLEAVRSASLLSHSPCAPTRKMCNAVLKIFRDEETSLELAICSYKLLMALEKRYPRAYLVEADHTNGDPGLTVVKEAWSPFAVGLDNGHTDGVGTSGTSEKLLDSNGFTLLLQEITEAVSETESPIKLKTLKDMLMLVYLVNVLEVEFLPRQAVYRETSNWVVMREAMLNMLLCSRRMHFKSLIRDCVTVIHTGCQLYERVDRHNQTSNGLSTSGMESYCDPSLTIAQQEIEKKAYLSVQKLLALVMELDVMKKEADIQGVTSRADSVRSSALEIILDELSYNKDIVSPFLQVFPFPKWKLDIVLQFFWKHCPKPSVRTRNSNKSLEITTFESALVYFSHDANIKGIVRRIGVEVAKVLLAHAFQAWQDLNYSKKQVDDNASNMEGSSLAQICKGILSAFENLRKSDKDADVLPLEAEAIFTAATILSMEA